MHRTLLVSSMTGLALWMLTACGGSTATLEIMDAPPAGVTAVSLFVGSMDVHVVDDDEAKDADPNDVSIDEDGQWESLQVNKAIDLAAHQGEGAAATLGELDLPAGKITQVRLTLDANQPNTVTDDQGICNIDMGMVSPTGIKINHVFKAFASGDDPMILVDFDLGKSLKVSGACYRLEPVLKLFKVRADGEDLAL